MSKKDEAFIRLVVQDELSKVKVGDGGDARAGPIVERLSGTSAPPISDIPTSLDYPGEGKKPKMSKGKAMGVGAAIGLMTLALVMLVLKAH